MMSLLGEEKKEDYVKKKEGCVDILISFGKSVS